MTHSRTIAYDAALMIAYIGLTAVMIALSLTLLALLALGAEFNALHAIAGLLNVLGFATLPFAPRLYQSLLGRTFAGAPIARWAASNSSDQARSLMSFAAFGA